MNGSPLSNREREARLDAELARRALEGWRLEYRGAHTAVIARRKTPNHVLHALLSIFTLGLWLFVWLVLVIDTRTTRAQIAVDTAGNVAPVLDLAAVSAAQRPTII